jgi:hypothetical protein
VFRNSGGRIPKSIVAAILRIRIYTGRFDWEGKTCRTYQGRYAAIGPMSYGERVQDVMDRRNARGAKRAGGL